MPKKRKKKGSDGDDDEDDDDSSEDEQMKLIKKYRMNEHIFGSNSILGSMPEELNKELHLKILEDEPEFATNKTKNKNIKKNPPQISPEKKKREESFYLLSLLSESMKDSIDENKRRFCLLKEKQ